MTALYPLYSAYPLLLRWKKRGEAAPPPEIPTGFMATPQDGATLLSWDAQIEADTFEIYFSTTNDFGTASQLTNTATGTSEPHDSDDSIQAGEPYYYWLRAINGAGESGWTGSVRARSYVTLAPTQSRVLTTPTGTWTLGTLFFGNSPDPLPNSVSLILGVSSYFHFDGDWYDEGESLANDTAASGAFTIANNSGGSITIWNGEP